jgi:uncharacterized protein (DUF1800 family)
MLTLKTAIATNRFGLGARPTDAARIGPDPEAWLLEQLGARPQIGGDSRPGSARMLEQITELRLARQALQAQRNNAAIAVDEDSIREYARFIAQQYQVQAGTGLTAAIGAEQPFRERLVRFWENHFAVSADKQPIGAIVGLYRDEAIRPHVSGNFRDLLQAVVSHPAMLLYLDNPASIGPNSLLGRRAAQRRGAGLNENLAREILELHTLGVDGGYRQDDVIELARALTGWSVVGAGGTERLGAMARRLTGSDEGGTPGEFAFRSIVHEPGTKTILGRRFAEDGVDETRAILGFLAGRPETARFIATKLARHFVADEPPAELIDRLAATYLEHDGELEPVYRELVLAPAAWREPRAKYKTPQEFLISVYRGLGTVPQGNAAVAVATQLGQRPQTPGSPAGWPDLAAHWNSGDALLKRIEWTTVLGASIGDRIDAVARLNAVLGEAASATTRQGLSRAESGAQAVALLFGAPEFQWR